MMRSVALRFATLPGRAVPTRSDRAYSWRMGVLVEAGYRSALLSSSLVRLVLIVVLAAAAITWIRRGAG